MKTNSKIFAANFNMLLYRNCCTKREISAALKVPYSTVVCWSTGRCVPRDERLSAVANYFGVRTSDLTEKLGGGKSTADIDRARIIDVLNNVDWLSYLSASIPEEVSAQLAYAIESAVRVLRITDQRAQTLCEGCQHIGLRYPYPAMYPCNACARAHRKDYYEPNTTSGNEVTN